MLIIPIMALIFIGGSYVLANRFLPPNRAIKAVPWMAAAALASFVLAQFTSGVIVGFLFGGPVPGLGLLFLIVGLAGAAAGAAAMLRLFVRRDRRRRAQREADAAIF